MEKTIVIVYAFFTIFSILYVAYINYQVKSCENFKSVFRERKENDIMAPSTHIIIIHLISLNLKQNIRPHQFFSVCCFHF